MNEATTKAIDMCERMLKPNYCIPSDDKDALRLLIQHVRKTEAMLGGSMRRCTDFTEWYGKQNYSLGQMPSFFQTAEMERAYNAGRDAAYQSLKTTAEKED